MHVLFFCVEFSVKHRLLNSLTVSMITPVRALGVERLDSCTLRLSAIALHILFQGKIVVYSKSINEASINDKMI